MMIAHNHRIMWQISYLLSDIILLGLQIDIKVGS